MAVPIPWDILFQNVLTAFLIIAYLAIELRYGRGRFLTNRINGLITVSLALAQENPNIDEEAVAERLDGDNPSDFIEDGLSHGSD